MTNELHQYFEYRCWRGLQELGLSNNVKYRDRLTNELEIITELDFPGYFLVVQDFISWARRNNIYVGVGRGSCVASLACYCLDITRVDPIKWGLLFERFINESRCGAPDYKGLLGDIQDKPDLTTNQILTIIESREDNNARIQNNQRMSSVSESV